MKTAPTSSSRARTISWTSTVLAVLVTAGPIHATPGAAHPPAHEQHERANESHPQRPVTGLRAMRPRTRVILGAVGTAAAIVIGRRLTEGRRAARSFRRSVGAALGGSIVAAYGMAGPGLGLPVTHAGTWATVGGAIATLSLFRAAVSAPNAWHYRQSRRSRGQRNAAAKNVSEPRVATSPVASALPQSRWSEASEPCLAASPVASKRTESRRNDDGVQQTIRLARQMSTYSASDGVLRNFWAANKQTLSQSSALALAGKMSTYGGSDQILREFVAINKQSMAPSSAIELANKMSTYGGSDLVLREFWLANRATLPQSSAIKLAGKMSTYGGSDQILREFWASHRQSATLSSATELARKMSTYGGSDAILADFARLH